MGMIVFVLGIIALGFIVGIRIVRNGKADHFDIAKGAVGLVVLGIMANGASAVVIVPAGHRAVVFNKVSGIKEKVLTEGLNFIIPFVEDEIMFDVRVQKSDVQATAASKDLQDVSTEVVLNFRPRAEAIQRIYKDYGKDYEAKVVTPAVQEAVKAVVATYTAEQIITKREELKSKVQEQLAKMIATADLDLVETYMTNFNFSKGFSEAIESKQIAEQSALKAQRDLERVKFEAEQKLAQAEAEAKGLRLQKDAITPELIQLRKVEMQTKAIEKWNGVLPTSMIPNATLPFLNLDTSK